VSVFTAPVNLKKAGKRDSNDSKDKRRISNDELRISNIERNG